jgi:hypothetical protein
VVDDEVTKEAPVDTADPTISIHALTSIHPCSSKTMQFFILINGTWLTAPHDSRSTHNFLDLEAATRVGIQFGGRSGLHVVVTNGDCINTLGCCRNMALSKADEHQLDCSGLALRCFDMVLGVQWLESLRLILWDFTRQTITFVRDGHQVCWSTTDATPSGLATLAVNTDIMADLLLCFDELFTEPAGLPPKRAHSHQIRLLPGMTPVAVRPYRYAYA